jgi:hypothetical protein
MRRKPAGLHTRLQRQRDVRRTNPHPERSWGGFLAFFKYREGNECR